MVHWEEAEDNLGRMIWLRFIDCGHWGLVLSAVVPRWIYPHGKPEWLYAGPSS